MAAAAGMAAAVAAVAVEMAAVVVAVAGIETAGATRKSSKPALAAAEEVSVIEKSLRQRLKPDSLQKSYVRAKARTLQRIEFFRSL